MWNEGSGASSFLCKTEKFALETGAGGGSCAGPVRGFEGEAPTETLQGGNTPAYCGAPLNSVMDSFLVQSSYEWLLHTEPDDNHQDWLLLGGLICEPPSSCLFLNPTKQKCCLLYEIEQQMLTSLTFSWLATIWWVLSTEI